MKSRIAQKLVRSTIIVLLIISLITGVGVVSIRIIQISSEKIAKEYHELNLIQDLRLSYNKLLIPVETYIIKQQPIDFKEFHENYINIQSHLKKCRELLSVSHRKMLLDEFENNLPKFDKYFLRIFNADEEKYPENLDVLMKEVHLVMYDVGEVIEIMLKETQHEIDKYIKINKTTANHSIITIILLSNLIMIILLLVGRRFVNNLTQPIMKLVHETDKLAKGNLTVKAEVESDDEMGHLAKSFNQMVESLGRTTVSRNYYDNIIESMFGSLIVTDKNGLIKSSNSSTRKMLGYSENELTRISISEVIDGYSEDFFKAGINKMISKSNAEFQYKTKEGKRIPVLISQSEMLGGEDVNKGIIYLAYDIREQKKVESELEQERKSRIIAINEAHEEERMKLAVELHDSLGQILTAISYKLDHYFSEKYKDDEDYQTKVTSIQRQIDLAIVESKNISHDLVPIVLKDFGLEVAIRNMINPVNSGKDIDIRFETFNYTTRIEKTLEKTLYRIVQESINNIIKHSKAQNAGIQLIMHPDSIVLIIDDNGIGFELNQRNESKSGLGLMSMRERVASHSGELTINSEIGKGTEIMIEIPYNYE